MTVPEIVADVICANPLGAAATTRSATRNARMLGPPPVRQTEGTERTDEHRETEQRGTNGEHQFSSLSFLRFSVPLCFAVSSVTSVTCRRCAHNIAGARAEIKSLV